MKSSTAADDTPIASGSARGSGADAAATAVPISITKAAQTADRVMAESSPLDVVSNRRASPIGRRAGPQ